jgi:hypothetical protein
MVKIHASYSSYERSYRQLDLARALVKGLNAKSSLSLKEQIDPLPCQKGGEGGEDHYKA